jgi:hypothetical protein
MLTFLIASCTNNTQQNAEEVDTKNEPENISNEVSEIDRTEYLTGEIITDGDYEISSSGIGSICFVPDKESREIIEEKYGTYDLYYLNDESYFLYYDNISVAESLPDELGIYKVRVKFDLKEIYSYDRFNIIDILLTDNIGTIPYEGKAYETNNLDLDVKVKDRVCGLIVESVDKFGGGGFRVGFCGEIETEGYYNISYSEMNESNYGTIHYDDKYKSNVSILISLTICSIILSCSLLLRISSSGFSVLLLIFYGVLNRIKCKIMEDGAEISYQSSAEEQEDTLQEQQLLLNGISLTKDIFLLTKIRVLSYFH